MSALFNQKVSNREQAASLAERMMNYMEKTGKALRVEVDVWQPKRSRDQQALIHILIRTIAISAGKPPEGFKQKYIKGGYGGLYPYWPQVMMDGEGGEKVAYPKSESDLTKVEESEQIEHLYAFAAEWGVEIQERAA